MLKIIDISSNNEVTDWVKVKIQCDGVIIKATEGVTYVNPSLAWWVHMCEQYQIPYGFYHFARRNNPVDEYKHFIGTVSQYDYKLGIYLDYEEENPDYNFIKLFMNCNGLLKFYSSHNIADNTGISKNKIWIAEPNEVEPLAIYGGYLGIQYSWKSRFNGIVGDVDVSVFDDSILGGQVTINNIKGSVSMIVIKVGENSARVKLLQSILKVLINNDIICDGVYGPQTASAVTSYQRIMNISADGIVGEETINTLLSDLRGGWFKA